MVRFGNIYPHQHQLSWLGRVGYSIYGYPFIGGFIRALYFKKTIKNMNFIDILDAGCGAGEYAFYLAQNYPRAHIDACDIEIPDYHMSLQRKLGLSNIRFIQKDLSELDSFKQYDLIICIDVLEHIKNNKEIIEKFYRHLREDGHLYLHMPERGSMQRRIFNPKFYKTYNQFSKEEHCGEEYTLEELVALLEKTGFKIKEARRTFGISGKLAWELDQLCRERKLERMRAVCLPLLKLLGWWDTVIKHKNGDGISVFSQKQ